MNMNKLIKKLSLYLLCIILLIPVLACRKGSNKKENTIHQISPSNTTTVDTRTVDSNKLIINCYQKPKVNIADHINMPIKSIIELMGQPNSKDNHSGGTAYFFENITYITDGNPNNEVVKIIAVKPPYEVNGIKINDLEDKMLGETQMNEKSEIDDLWYKVYYYSSFELSLVSETNDGEVIGLYIGENKEE